MDGITWDEVEQVCALAEAEKTVAGLRDSSLIRLMSDCLLRISEAVAVNVGDVNGVLTIHQSKTDQGTRGYTSATLYIGDPTRLIIRRYCEAGGITNGALFRRIRRGDNITDRRLTVDGVRKIIKRRARAAGVEGKISGHSLRIGSAVSLAQAGAVCCEYAGCGTMEIPSDARALRTRRISRERRDCTVQIQKMTIATGVFKENQPTAGQPQGLPLQELTKCRGRPYAYLKY